jgi:type 1 fimbriae regulatory protein FimE
MVIATPPQIRHVRSREYLFEQEVEALMEAAKRLGRHGHRDATMILLAYRHGLRVTELITLRWDQINWDTKTLAVTRLKAGTPSTHPLTGKELRALRQLRRQTAGPVLFMSERRTPGTRGAPMTRRNFAQLLARAGVAAGLPFPVRPHNLRHGCGYKLANDGQDTRAIQHYLGHKNIQHTVRYTELSPDRFQHFWKD